MRELGCDNIFDRIFIAIGNAIINAYNSIINFNIEKIIKNPKNEKDTSFKDVANEKENKDKINDLREIIIENIGNAKILLIITLIILLISTAFGIEFGILTLVVTLLIIGTIIYYPKIKSSNKYDDLNLELPYALRHMGTELKSGKGLYDTLQTISDADYGSFSKELKRAIEEIKYGESSEKAFLNISRRAKSDGLTRAMQQIIGTLRVGGNLANSLNIIANDISFDMQIKLKEYSQKLNGFILIYTFIAILGPVLLLIMLMAASTIMGNIVTSDIILLIYVIFFPAVVVFLAVFIKKLEPKI